MTIPEIKAQLTIDRVLNHYGLQPNRNGMINCPFHDDKTPSMKVYFDTNTVHCFSGNCSQQGKAIDVIDFIFYYEKCTKHQAILKAKQLLGEVVNPPKVSKSITKKSMINYEEAFLKLRQGIKNPRATKYLQSRGFSDVKLEIGFKDKATGTKIITGMADCLIFPLKDAQGKIVSLYGRSLSDKKSQRHHYSKGRSGLYPGYPDPAVRTLVLTESVIDALTVQQYTDYDVLALYGINGLKEEHLEALRGCPELEEVIFFLDGDTAGRSATQKYAKDLHALFPNLVISEVQTLENEDPNSLIQSHDPSILNHLMSERKGLFSEIPVTEAPQSKAIPTKPTLDVSKPEYPVYATDLLHIRVMGGIALRPVDKLVVTLSISKVNSLHPLHQLRHRLDLYNDDLVEKLIQKTAEKLELGSREVQRMIAQLIDELEQHRMAQLEAQKPQKVEKRTLTPIRERHAIAFLARPGLLKNTNDLIGQSGVVGEPINRLLMFLVFASRLRAQPLHIVCLGASGTGKTYLQERVSALIPEAEKLEITALSENALYYLGKTELKHKLVLIEDLDGASQDGVLYAIRELQSKQQISKTVPIKDSKGNFRTVKLEVEGPICLAGTTTRERLYEDNANRSLLIYLDNSPAQQEAIMAYQRKISAGTVDKQAEERAREFLLDVQSVLKPVKVKNPYAEQLVLPKTVFKPLRTNAHYLHFIEVITFYKQYQRATKTDPLTKEKYLETTLEDIEEANTLLKEVLLAKSDELTKACRTFLESLKLALKQNRRLSFYRSEVREWMRINPNNLRYYLKQLVNYGYLQIVQRHKRQGNEYEITRLDEYTQLCNQLTVLDSILARIKSKES